MKSILRNVALLGCLTLALALPGCAAINSVLAPNPNVVASLEATLAAAENAAFLYVELPTCGKPGAGQVCKKISVVRNIDKARSAAYTAVTAAEANETADTVTAAENAVSAYQAVVNAAQTN